MYTLCKYKAIVQSSLVRTRTEFLLPIKLYELEFILYSLCIKDVNRYHNRISIQRVFAILVIDIMIKSYGCK